MFFYFIFLAQIYGITSFFFVSASIAGFCLETLPQFQFKPINASLAASTQLTTATTLSFGNTTIAMETTTRHTPNITSCYGMTSVVTSSHVGLHVLDFTCTVFFTLELIARFLVSPTKLKFMLNIMNAVDLLALVPLYVQIVVDQLAMQACYTNERFIIRIMFILRIFRMFRIFHLVKHYQALKVLVYALKASLRELLMLFIFLLLAMLIFASVIYYAESGSDDVAPTKITNIPVGFWWAIITMTMVGYGDKVPKTTIGYIVSSACSLVGVLLFALTFPIIANNFTLFYTHIRSREVNSPKSKCAEEKRKGCEE